MAVEWVPALTSNNFEALRDLVRCGAGVAILPYRAVLRESTAGPYQADRPRQHAPRRPATTLTKCQRTNPLADIGSYPFDSFLYVRPRVALS